jgi:hypothetical protein
MELRQSGFQYQEGVAPESESDTAEYDALVATADDEELEAERAVA